MNYIIEKHLLIISPSHLVRVSFYQDIFPTLFVKHFLTVKLGADILSFQSKGLYIVNISLEGFQRFETDMRIVAGTPEEPT